MEAMNIFLGLLASTVISWAVNSQTYGATLPLSVWKEKTLEEEIPNSSDNVTVENIFHSLGDLILSVDSIANRIQNTTARVKTGELLLEEPAINSYSAAYEQLMDTSIKILGGLASIKKILSGGNPKFTLPVAEVQNDIEPTLQTLKEDSNAFHKSIGEMGPKLRTVSELSLEAFRNQQTSKFDLHGLRTKMNTLDHYVQEYTKTSRLLDEAYILIESYPPF